MISKLMVRFLYWGRDLRSRKMFAAICKVSQGRVLDIGGGQFFSTITKYPIKFEKWVSVEPIEQDLGKISDPRFSRMIADGCCLPIEDESFDTVLNIQVLEHVFEPIKMFNEAHRVLKKGGAGVFLTPQTSNLHLVPNHFYNFTRFWLLRAAREAGFEIISLEPLGGVWSTLASKFFFFFFHAFRFKGTSTSDDQRKPLFYVLLPFMMLFAMIVFPFCMIFSLADLTEYANNFLLVVRKKD